MEFDARRPNHLLRYARQEHGWSQQRVAEQIGTTEDVVSRWERGMRMPSPYYREKLCLLFQRNARDLGLVHNPLVENSLGIVKPEAVVGEKGGVMTSLEHFSFGELPTSWIVVDGDGTYSYLPQNIIPHFEGTPEELPLELQERRRRVAWQQAENRRQGLLFHWNGQRYSLNRFVISREGLEENLALDLWFTPTDYYTFLATNMALDDHALRAKYLQGADWSRPVPFFSNSFGIYLLVLTADDQVLFTHRGQGVGSRPGEYSVSVCEGLGVIDTSPRSAQMLDLYGCAERGLSEELGLKESEDFTTEDIHFLSFGVDSWYSQWGLLGFVKVQKTAQAILNYRKVGVKDRMENAQIYVVPFDIDAVVSFVFAHQLWTPGGLTCLYHTLVQEFGRTRVADSVLGRSDRKQV